MVLLHQESIRRVHLLEIGPMRISQAILELAAAFILAGMVLRLLGLA